MSRTLLAVWVVVLSVAGLAQAQPVIHGPGSASEIGTYELLADTPNQAIQIFVSGGQAVQGVNFNVQIADGGPEAGGIVDGPAIVGVDLTTGTIFGSNNTGLGSSSGALVPQVAFYSTTTASGTVQADGLLATLTVDTTGFFDGDFALTLSQTLNSSTNFASSDPGLVPTIIDGQITIVPEPATLASMALGTMVLLRRRCR